MNLSNFNCFVNIITQAQHGTYKGKCGVCGDKYGLPHPQPNENTGKYGGGKIVKTYSSGQLIDVEAVITANHLGNIQYHICKITNSNLPESGEECFKLLPFADGSDKLIIKSTHRVVKSKVQLPKGLKCNHCVLRWTYTAGKFIVFICVLTLKYFNYFYGCSRQQLGKMP